MATDNYIKFGEDPEDDRMPDIQGDSTDDDHYWWCELRECDFGLKAAERSPDGETGDSKDKPKPTFDEVTIKKRVDWASTQLFRKCCEAAEARTKKSDEEKGKGRIDQVTIEVCKAAGTEKFPYVIVRFYGVQVVDYEISMTEPEPAETLKLKFEKFEFDYQQTDPETGRKMGNLVRTTDLKNYENADASVVQTGGSFGGGSSTVTTAAPAITSFANAGTAAVTAANPSTPGAPPAPSAPPPVDVSINANFPGLWSGNGFGLLPD